MERYVLYFRCLIALFFAAALRPQASAASLCGEPALTVSQLSNDRSRTAGQVLIEGRLREAPWGDQFVMEDTSTNGDSITVFKSAETAIERLQAGDVVRVKGSLQSAIDPFQLLTVRLEDTGGNAIAACPEQQGTDSLTQPVRSRHLTQSQGRTRRERRDRGSSRSQPASPSPRPMPEPMPEPMPVPNPEPEPVPEPEPEMPPPGPAGDTWRSSQSLPLSMGEVSAGVLTLGGVSYLIVVGEHPTGDSKNGVTMIFDLSKQMWIEASSRPEIGNHHASEVIGNEMYLFGGLSDGEGDIQIGTLVDTGMGVDIMWRKGAGLPFDGGSAATAVIAGKVYYCGGINRANTRTVSNCAIYDPETDSWTTDTSEAPNMPIGRNHAAACTDGTKLFVFGGRDGRNVVGPGFAETQILEPGQGWTMGTPLPLARGGMGKAVYHEGRCFVFGGEVSTDVAVSEADKIEPTRTVFRVDIYDISSDSWSLAQDMPQGLHGIFPVKHNGEVHIAAGGTEAAFSQSELYFVYTL
eukprot:jgi/Ulvmu1/11527/UM078_0016.1